MVHVYVLCGACVCVVWSSYPRVAVMVPQCFYVVYFCVYFLFPPCKDLFRMYMYRSYVFGGGA